MSSSHEHLSSQLQLIWHNLRNVKERFGPLFLSEDEPSTVRQLIFGKQLEIIENIERLTTPIDWNNLATWIQNADEFFQQQQRRGYSDYLTLLGHDAGKTNWFDIVAHGPIEMMQSSAAGQQLRRDFGPNWLAAGLDALQYLSPAPNSNNSVAPRMFKTFISMRSQKITEYWSKLRKDVEGRASFRRKWCQLTRMARKQWLQMRGIPTDPHFHIYAWAKRLKSGNQPIERTLFISSLLNIEDLSDGNVLPDFLDARANIRPPLFRHTDSFSVLSGAYTGYLPLKCVPGMVVKFNSKTGGTDEYSISLERNYFIRGASISTDHNEEHPGIALLQLEAQQRIYGFLADCLLVGLNDPCPEPGNESSSHITNDGEQPSLLTRAMRLDYYGRPGTINLKYLSDLVNASLDEAREDLWQLRQDCEVWMNRLDKTPGTMLGRTSNLLRAVFCRIDSFHTLSRRLLVLEKYEYFAEQNRDLDISGLSKDGEALESLMSLHVAFSSILEEHLCRMESMSWPDGAANCSVLFQLLELLRTNDPALRVLGLPAVMRVIDREIEKVDFKESASFTTIQALNDVSVLAGCLKETSENDGLVSIVGEHVHLANELENEWSDQDRPWRSVIEETLASLGETECRKLDGHIRNRNTHAQSRYVDFWQVIDRHMTTSSQGNMAAEKVVHEIQQVAPIVMTRRTHTQADWVGRLNDASGVTMTKLRRTRHRRYIQDDHLVLVPGQISNERSLPVIKPLRDIWFWNALSAPSSENSSELLCSVFKRPASPQPGVMSRQATS